MAVDEGEFNPRVGAPGLLPRAPSFTGRNDGGPALAWRLLIAGALGLSFGYALAQSAPQPSTYNPPAFGEVAPAKRPGHLRPSEVIDKKLLDFMGNSLGVIQAVTPDGRMAVVMPSGNSVPFTVAMSRLSIGMGSHTIIQDARNDLDPYP